MEQVEMIITLIVFGVLLIAAIATFGLKLGGSLKTLIENKDWAKIVKAINSAVLEAEASGKTGADKKQMVLNSVEAFADSLGIAFDIEKVGEYIDQILEIHNELNKNKKKAIKDAKKNQ